MHPTFHLRAVLVTPIPPPRLCYKLIERIVTIISDIRIIFIKFGLQVTNTETLAIS